jgi:nucleoside-diphosphate-sugar epimerase
MTTVVLGCGEVGACFARQWRVRHPESRLICTVLRESSRDRLGGIDAEIEVVDLLDQERLREVLRGAGRVLFSAAPGRDGHGDLLWSDGMRNLVEVLDLKLEPHVVHVSSTGVYAEDSGGDVDEDSLLADGPRPKSLIAAESALGEVAGVHLTILRSAGLVGSGRGPQRGLSGVAGSSRPGGDGWLNLVWVDDVAAAIVQAFENELTGVYNIAATAMRRRDFYDPLLARAGLEPVHWQAEPPALGRRVLSSKFDEAFGIELRSIDPTDLDWA